MAAGHLATLETTAQILAALRKAGAAVARMRAGLGPVAHIELPVSELASADMQQQLEDTNVSCTQLQASACGRWLAVGTSTKQVTPREAWSHAVVICSTEGLVPQQRLACSSWRPSIHWAPDPHLSIALSPFPGDQRPGIAAPGIPAAVIVDAPSGAVLSSLSTGTIASAQVQLREVGWLEHQGRGDAALWSPCGTKLLVGQDISDTNPGTQQPVGWLSLYDVVRDELMLETECHVSTEHAASVWHPSSAGIVVPATGGLKDAGAFARAGVALGILPAPCGFAQSEGLGFLADAQHYLAKPNQPYGSPALYWILRCTLQGLDICFELVHKVQACSLYPVPRSCLAITKLDQGTWCSVPSMLKNLFCDEAELCLGRNAPGLRTPLSFSPSGQLVSDSEGFPRIFSVQTGALLWVL